MAEAVLFYVASDIIKKLNSRAFREIGLWWGVNDELKKLSARISTIQAVLLDAEEKYYSESENSHQVKHWVGELKEAFYDADDLLDDFNTDALRSQVMGGNKFAKEVRLFFSSSNQFTYGLKVAHKVKAIRERLDDIADSRKFHLVERTVETSAMAKGREETHSSLPQVFVGRDSDKMAIIELLFSSDYEENVAIIPIVGIGGLGKTTLAQCVFNDEKVDALFELKLWACVSDDFDVKLILKKILELGSGSDLPLNALKNQLLEKINGKKFLLVLDDIWNEDLEKWRRLKDLLLGGARGSRTIVTTRMEKVAQVTSKVPAYKLKGLPESESWDLFTQVAFRRGLGAISPSQVEIGKDIVAKCRGVPLAIKTIGGLLYFKDTELEWLDFKNKEFSELNQQENDILPTLKLSYNHLPSHLKHCFAYCSLFPKDHAIDASELVDLWIAQGYIKSSNSEKRIEDIGHEYCMDLLWRSLLEEARKDESGKVVYCKMHDLMHDLATLVRGRESLLWDSNVGDFGEKFRHVSFDFGEKFRQVPPSLFKSNKLRSFLVPQNRKFRFDEGQCDVLFSNFRCLRALDLKLLDIQTLPCSIYKLKHLRYLNLSRSKIEVLPDAITRLHNLQVLKLYHCVSLKQLPKGMKKLVNLRCLDISFTFSLTHMPRGIGRLTNLRELSKFVVGKDYSISRHIGGLGELHALNSLKGSFQIENLQYLKNSASECKAANLIEKQDLESLELRWAHDGDCANDSHEAALEALQPHRNLQKFFVYGYGGMKFPTWLPCLSKLKVITFHSCKKCQRLPPLHHLPSLNKLNIWSLNDLEYIDNGGDSVPFFRSLKDLWLSNCPNLKGWFQTTTTTNDLPQFPCLSNLQIHSCPNLTSMPPFPPLEAVSLYDAGMEIVEQIFKVKNIVQPISPSSPSSSSSVSQIKIDSHADLQFLSENSLQHLTSLKRITIHDYPRLTALLSLAAPHLTSLDQLAIANCEELKLFDDDDENDLRWQGLKSLRELCISKISKFVSFPKGLQQLTTLRTLDVHNCPNLISLPESMVNLTTLQTLTISRCPQLSERCGNNTAEYWPFIAHIPYIRIDNKDIQRNGRYQL